MFRGPGGNPSLPAIGASQSRERPDPFKRALDDGAQVGNTAGSEKRQEAIRHGACRRSAWDRGRAIGAPPDRPGRRNRERERPWPSRSIARAAVRACRAGRSGRLRSRASWRRLPKVRSLSSACASRARRKSASSRPTRCRARQRLKGVSVLEIVNDDMPFLVDSVMAALAARNLSIRLVVHPIFAVVRDASGKLQRLLPDASGAELRESFIHVHLDRVDDDARRDEVVQEIEQSLADVRVSVQDWRADARPRRRGDRRDQGQSAGRCRLRKFPKRSSFWNGCAATISRCSACATIGSRLQRKSRNRCRAAVLGSCAIRNSAN